MRISAAQALAEDQQAATASRELHVWSCLWDAVHVYECCALDVGVGMAVVYNGIRAQEVLAACRLLCIARAQWPELVEDVQYMGRVASNALNARKPQG